MPNNLNYVIHKTRSEERKVMVINGLPFYSSSGTSQDSQSKIRPAWRQDMWMPLGGLSPGFNVGWFMKPSDYLDSSQFELWKKTLVEILNLFLPEIPDEELKLFEQSFILNNNKNDFLDKNELAKILVKEFERFGTMEAMVISMIISPLPWEKNTLLSKFKIHILKQYSQYKPSNWNELPGLLKEAQCFKTIQAYTIQTDAKADYHAQLRTSSQEMNQWLLEEINKQNNVNKGPSNNHLSDLTISPPEISGDHSEKRESDSLTGTNDVAKLSTSKIGGMTAGISLILFAALGAALVATGIFAPFGVSVLGGIYLATIMGGGAAIIGGATGFCVAKTLEPKSTEFCVAETLESKSESVVNKNPEDPIRLTIIRSLTICLSIPPATVESAESLNPIPSAQSTVASSHPSDEKSQSNRAVPSSTHQNSENKAEKNINHK